MFFWEESPYLQRGVGIHQVPDTLFSIHISQGSELAIFDNFSQYSDFTNYSLGNWGSRVMPFYFKSFSVEYELRTFPSFHGGDGVDRVLSPFRTIYMRS